MKPTITPADFVQMQKTTKTLIECVFQREDSFKKVLSTKRALAFGYEILQVHFSGDIAKVIIILDEDASDLVLYLDLDDIYSWYCEEFEKIKKEKK